MSVYLEAVAQAAERRTQSETEFRAALARAAEHHSLRQIAPHAGLTYSGVAFLLKTTKGGDDERP